MKTNRILKLTPTSVETLGEYTAQECKTFLDNAETFMRNMSEAYPHLAIIRRVYSVQLWDNKLGDAVLTYQVAVNL